MDKMCTAPLANRFTIFITVKYLPNYNV